MPKANNDRLDCLLSSPPIFYEDSENIWKEGNSNFPPLGLASIGAYARHNGYSVKIIDCNIVSSSVESFQDFFEKNYAEKYSDIRVIGITSVTCTIKKAYKIAKICKEIYPDAIIVFGGVHATFVTDEVINNNFIDIISLGESEHTFKEILDAKNPLKIDGIVFKKKTKRGYNIIRNKNRDRIVDLDSLPMPAYDLLPIEKYRPAKGTYKRLPAMSMMTSRGCPGRCTFCSKTMGNRLVFKSAEKIFDEIMYLIENYGIRQILFYDDTFTVYKKNVEKLCDMILENNVDISWTCFARVDFIDPDMLSKMKTAGCHQIMYGVENVDETVLKNINKKINIPQVVNVVRWTKKAGIECRLSFMVGNPGDNEQIIRKNIKFVNKINPDLLVVNITTPFPGTAMFKWAKERNLILTYDWDDYTLAKPVMRLENLSAEQIKDLYKLMYRSFYFRPSFIIKRLLSIRSLDDASILLGGSTALLSFFKPKNKQKSKDTNIRKTKKSDKTINTSLIYLFAVGTIWTSVSFLTQDNSSLIIGSSIMFGSIVSYIRQKLK